jgi:hypothetical protein
VPRRLALAPLLVLAACAHEPTVQERWLEARGDERGSVGCVKLAAALRAECGGATECEERVSYDFSFSCYTGVYRDDDDTDLGPCFWDDGKAPVACDQIGLPPALVPHCTAEVAFATTVLCKLGSPAFTGAGP